MLIQRCQRLPENLEELGALRSLLRNEWLQERMVRLGGGQRRQDLPHDHIRPRNAEDFRRKLLKRICVNELTGCWDWTGPVLKKSRYGRMSVYMIPTLVHRLSWLLHRGEIPNGLFVLHTCDNRVCCNPEHLFLGTNQDNMNDMKSKGRQKTYRGEQNGHAVITNDQAREIKSRGRSGEELRQLCADFPMISETGIRDIISGKSWAWLEV